jgi:hypothetical protein
LRQQGMPPTPIFADLILAPFPKNFLTLFSQFLKKNSKNELFSFYIYFAKNYINKNSEFLR